MRFLWEAVRERLFLILAAFDCGIQRTRQTFDRVFLLLLRRIWKRCTCTQKKFAGLDEPDLLICCGRRELHRHFQFCLGDFPNNLHPNPEPASPILSKKVTKDVFRQTRPPTIASLPPLRRALFVPGFLLANCAAYARFQIPPTTIPIDTEMDLGEPEGLLCRFGSVKRRHRGQDL